MIVQERTRTMIGLLLFFKLFIRIFSACARSEESEHSVAILRSNPKLNASVREKAVEVACDETSIAARLLGNT